MQISKKISKAADKSSKDVPTNEDDNRYQALSEEEDMETEVPGQARALLNSNSRKADRQPPIYNINSNINSLISKITALTIPKSAFLIKEVDRDNHIVYTNSAEHYKAVSDMLLENKVQYFTYTPKNLKPKSILLKGVRGDFNLDFIKQEIVNLNIPDLEVLSITKFIFNKALPHRFHHLIQLPTDSKTANMFKVKSIAYQKVRWEHLKKPSLFQCKKCQKLGHAS